MDADNRTAQVVAPLKLHPGTSLHQEEFFREHYRDLIAITMYVGANEEQAKEAVAAALEVVVLKWADLRDPFRYATKAAINHFRKEKTRGLDRSRIRLAEKGAGTPEGRDDPRMNLWADEEWVAQMLASLPPKQAEAMRFVVEGYTPTEIAGMFGYTRGAVSKNLQYARARLKQAISRELARDQQPDGARSSSGKKA